MAKDRGNGYYEGRLKREHPVIYTDWRAGKYSSLRQASIAAGLKREQTRSNVLKREWKKATPKEQADFLLWASAPTTSSSFASLVDVNRRLLPRVAARIQEIKDRRRLEMGDVMDEMGFDRLDASLGRALRSNTRLRPDVITQLEKWLQDNRRV